MLQNLGGGHLIVILFIVLLLFGAPKLPGLAKSLGQSARILKKEVTSEDGEKTESGAVAADASSAVSENAETSKTTQDQSLSERPTPDVR
ncbi:hypothetical protein G7067_00585 [Leucobacter insecticola]|uniref:Sec-independent protein translocase protein TatA n=1 Tax=Leucobacter insecticola TaxID=2714934 RepID=A0A6G8FFT7_9MICO|nr:twin-arginine translocase TatA/TatE family subunit [Leucobacter insecticola]QIM15251.1 hypothetical protein G7067_00585 [Leucobacter insecticola]